jgi:host factor-I protein
VNGIRMPGNVQDHYLAEIKRQAIAVTVTLCDGLQLRGTIGGFDPFTISLTVDGKSVLVYKHAVSTVTPEGAFTFAPPGGGP